MTKLLQISAELGLPLEVLTDSIAIVGRKRVGKSNTAVVIVEEALDLGAQAVIFDPKGDWWGLRSSADGESAGYPVVVIGGQHAMLPLNPLAGVAVADWIIDTGHSVILDISDLEPAECERFCSDVLRQLRKRKKAKPGTILLVFEEADELAPQDTRFGSAFLKTLGLVIWMVKRGGFLGIGTMVVTQRAASINKNVLTQTELFIALQTTGSQDIEAEQGWFKHQMSKEDLGEFLANIAKLEKGEAFVASGQILRGTLRIHVRRRRTFDSGATPEMGELAREPKVVADVDLQQLDAAMAAAVEEVKKTDPEILRKRIRELERRMAGGDINVATIEKIVNVPVLAAGELEQIRAIATDLLEASTKLYDGARRIQDAVYPVINEMQRIAPSAESPSVGSRFESSRTDDDSAVRAAAPRSPTAATVAVRASDEMTPGLRTPSEPMRSGEPRATNSPTQQRILDAVRLLEHRDAEISIVAIAAVAGVHPNGGRFRGDIKALVDQQLLTPGYGLTDRGRGMAAIDDKISMPQQKILEVAAILQGSRIEGTPQAIAAWLDLNANGGRFRGDLKYLQTVHLLEGYRVTRAAKAHVDLPIPDAITAAAARLDPSTSRLFDLIRGAEEPLTVTKAGSKLNLHPNGGRFRSSIARLADMGVIKSRSELALSDPIREAAEA